jgi:hypothetical protein
MRPLYWIALVLTIVGALNWGLVGLFQFDLVAAIFGGAETMLARIVYALVGLAGLGLLGIVLSTNTQPRDTMTLAR